jgi:hypothetical protein
MFVLQGGEHMNKLLGRVKIFSHFSLQALA